MRRVNRHRRQQRVKFSLAIALHKAKRVRIEFVQSQHTNSVLRKGWTQLAIPAIILVVYKFMRQLVEQFALFRQGQAVGAGVVIAVLDLLHHRRHPHFKELVQVAGGNGEKLQPFEQRVVLVRRFLQDAAIKREPGSIAIQEVLRIVERDTSHDGRAYRILCSLVISLLVDRDRRSLRKLQYKAFRA